MGFGVQWKLPERVRMTLREHMSAEFGAAKTCWAVIVLMQLTLTLGSAGSLFISSRRILLTTGVLLLIIPVTTLFLKRSAEAHYRKGEVCRRLYMLEDSLGRKSGATDLLIIKSEATAIPSLDPRSVGRYFNSPSPRGLQRLVENLEESAFYTRRLARLATNAYATATVMGVLAAMVVLWLGVQMVPANGSGIGVDAERFARAFCELFAFFSAGVLAEIWSSYSELSESADRTFQDCDSLRKGNGSFDEIDVLWVANSYDVALAKAMPIPGVFQRLYGRKLERAWSEVFRTPGRGAKTRPG